MAGSILVATHKQNPIARIVTQKLQEKGHAPYVINTDEICQRTVPFAFIFEHGESILQYGSQKIHLSDIRSAWYWRAIVASITKDAYKKHAIEREMQKTLWGIWESIDEVNWLNPPPTIKRTQNKLLQLRYAATAGLTTIPTIATNNWQVLEDAVADPLIVKMPGRGTIESTDQMHALYTTVIAKRAIKKLRYASPFPGMYQPFLSKKREWRITIVGNTVFSAAIYTNKDAKNDWRQQQNTDSVRFVAEDFPANTITKCKKLMSLLGLRYGAFDFIETEDGTLYFVEINSNGQYLWLEKKLDFPISEAIAGELIAIANN
jgi:hypothetical protein